ncbi:sphingomyelin phosphodiesterase 2 isoform X2 [Meriones unguiculatus]|uniref:sphingomyelin phosphodiesterase 2 isoform X2 n=1 Tax=Meriones unguiculatus TaxID=10047 RepID=UPI00293F53B8|nr:sphingomyelin phosphodiesterase 2 isoform X2 [Meriones unguiculatus]
MKPNFSVRLRVFNLNCWDIPYLSKHRADRLKRLGDFLNLESFDLALLEEVWSEQDFQYLRQKLSLTYPDAHYFRRHQIQEITQHVYTLNGYPYMFYHGDWFCGKAVGLLVLQLGGVVLNTYVTHLHAEYSRQKDIYLTHRVTQAWELAQFIHHTSKNADVVLLCGDLNMHPKDLGCRLLREWTGLRDAYVETQDFKGSEDGCTMVPRNCYVSQQDLGPFPSGIRIDYVLYKAVSGFHIYCKTLKTTTGCDPHNGTPFSDHEALMATLHVKHGPPQEDPCPAHGPRERSALISALREAWTELGLGMAQARRRAAFAGYVTVCGLSLLVLLCVLAAGEEAREAAILLWTPSAGLVLGAGTVYLFHMHEAKGLCRAQAELQHVLRREKETQVLGSEQQEGDRAEEQ